MGPQWDPPGLFWVLALLPLVFLSSAVFFLVSWKKCLHLGSTSAWTAASRTSVSGSSAPHCFSVFCARPSCLPVSSTSCRSILMTTHLGLWLSLPRSSRTWPTLPSRRSYRNHFLKTSLKSTWGLTFRWAWGTSSLMLHGFHRDVIKNSKKIDITLNIHFAEE